ncbi:MAG: cardiolipin synthase [Patescibacteria group bacterium]|nr:phosphatidylserine/phosphatidylglycerophosphate/cardiolipin synthase family protein [Candidatus Saccharibacteria bacterium]MDQ5963009.1 cardiolipin synthase [Patescibacteria group bacterium]
MKRQPELLLPQAFVQEAIKKIGTAKVRVRLISTIMTEDASTRRLIRALAAASKRGVDIEVGADVFTFGVVNNDWNPLSSFNRGLRSARQMRKHLLAAGVTFQWIGRLGPVLFAGRTHIKWLIVDDYVYSFGGVNLYKPGISHADYMLGMANGSLADRLEDEHRRIVRADKIDKFYKSHSFESMYGTVLIDGGIFNNSIIYNRACKLALEAEKVLLVSQYCPSGKLGRILSHTSTRFYFNHWKNATKFNRILIRTGMFFSGILTDYTRREYIHAKFMIFEMPDGQKIALTGSHNFVHGGVLLGTREIALETTNPTIIAQLEGFWKEHIE